MSTTSRQFKCEKLQTHRNILVQSLRYEPYFSSITISWKFSLNKGSRDQVVESIQCHQHKLFNKEFYNIYLFDDFHYNSSTNELKNTTVYAW